MYSRPLFVPHLSLITAWFCMGVSPGRKQNTSEKRHHYLPPPPPVRAPWVDLVKPAQLLAKYHVSRNVKSHWVHIYDIFVTWKHLLFRVIFSLCISIPLFVRGEFELRGGSETCVICSRFLMVHVHTLHPTATYKHLSGCLVPSQADRSLP